MWVYVQSSGKLYQDSDPETFYLGYAGHGEGKNSPAHQHVKNVGPLPVGHYDIGAPYDSTDHGPYVLRLTPAPENDMHGRSSFLIHGDSRTLPGSASHGCIIQSKPARMAVWLSDDHVLRVVASSGA